jgi:hypothetical protein
MQTTQFSELPVVAIIFQSQNYRSHKTEPRSITRKLMKQAVDVRS